MSKEKAQSSEAREKEPFCAKTYDAASLKTEVKKYFAEREADKEPPSIPSLCWKLKILPETWQAYCDREAHPDMHETVTFAYMRIEAYLVTELYKGKSGIPTAIGMFCEAKAKTGKKETTETDVPIAEKVEMICHTAKKIEEQT